ncbi:GNAT family N-acetyltransferase [Spirosoma terrae]|uniref:GNAT family N-acetyltransferase n=1 Tax=Spirosoma terrae TaxID=1968276 RepID=A0A6L9L9V1_9BACT|nr:GNAT family N-acetyltransferase [Spirosoma terrae]NDU96247.1 GNAT family N-acetyltransferase [Spirosoma terrae]
MQLLRIAPESPYLATVRPWYEGSFPPEERRNFDQLVQLLDLPDMHFCVLVDQSTPVGFISYWQWGDLLYVEHVAIDPEKRGQKFGEQALQQVVALQATCVVLEVELPEDSLSVRRVQFYERQGFYVNEFPYVQPPYRLNETGIPMKLLSIPAIPDSATFQQISDQINENVYRRFYDKPIG